MRIIFIMFFVVTTCFSQKKEKTIYVDENYLVISKKLHKKRLKSEIYHSLSYDLDTIKYEKLRLSYFFGKFEKIKKQQLFKLLFLRNGIDTTKTLVFHYSDTLKAKYLFTKRDGVVDLKNGKHKHEISYDTYLKRHIECVEKWEKNIGVTMLHYYNINIGHPEKVGKVKWYKDPSGVVRNIFRDDYKNYNFFVVKPNGQFFVYSLRGTQKINYEKLITSRWDYYEKKFNKTYEKLNRKK